MNCEFCERDRFLTEHHLIPKSTHSKKGMQRRYSKKEMKARKINICRECHDAVHQFFNEKTLAKEYNTKELLLANQAIINFIAWVKRQK
jgi:hypothetical protein